MVHTLIRGAMALVLTSCVVDVEAAGGDTTTIKVMESELIYCNGAVDCPEDPDCAVWWCQQIQKEEPDNGKAWGRCKLAESVGGASCDHGEGICVNKVCKPLR